MRINTFMINRIVSNNFFKDSKLVNELFAHKFSNVNTALDFKTTADLNWMNAQRPWLDAIDLGVEHLEQIEQDYKCNREDLVDVWIKRNIDIWNLEDHTNYHRENADIHKDYFEGFSKVINLQVYVSEDIPPEAGTCFWEYTGSDLLSDTLDGKGEVAKWPFDNWKIVEQIPFEPNLAFTYNAGPDGVFHSAPPTEMLLESQVPSHTREVIIIRFRYK